MKTGNGLFYLSAAIMAWSGMTATAWGKDFCNVPRSQWQAQSALVKKLEGQGWKIRNLKIDGGCYEVYGTDGNGKARETHFNPATFQAVAERHQG